MAKMGDRHADPHEEIPLDGIGGVNIIVKADVHRSGINFPAYGLPNYVVWHIDTDEKPGNA